MNPNCSLCSRSMYVLPTTTPTGRSMTVAICRTCDRRACTVCRHAEQNVYARMCSKCGATFK